MSDKDDPWKLDTAAYTRVREHADITIGTQDGKTWNIVLRRYTAGAHKAFLVLEARGLRERSVAMHVADDLYKLAKTIVPNDCTKNNDGLVRRRKEEGDD